MSVGSELHGLIVNPGNSSLVLGALHHAAYRPANYAFGRLTGGRQLWRGLSPETWGAAVAKAGEKVDYGIGTLTGAQRNEAITLQKDHLARIKQHVESLEANPHTAVRGQELRRQFDEVIAKHHSPNETLNSVLQHHTSNDDYKITLHDVKLPSATGEVGKTIKNIGTDAAALYGSAELVNRINRVASQPSEENKPMSSTAQAIKEAIEKLEKAAALLADIPKRDAAYKQASELHHDGAIAEHEVAKYASLFYDSPDHVDTIVSSLARQNDETKSARMGEVVTDGNAKSANARGEGGRYASFDQFCLNGGGR
jgi:hypothetical protein